MMNLDIETEHIAMRAASRAASSVALCVFCAGSRRSGMARASCDRACCALSRSSSSQRS
jgi:hypothetical protein